MPSLYNQKGHVSMEINVDSSFTGILRGQDSGVAEPIHLKGTVVVHVYKPIKVRRISIRFEGRCKVNINTSKPSKLVAASPPEGVECRNLVKKKTCLLLPSSSSLPEATEEESSTLVNEQKRNPPVLLPPGEYTYPYTFELPPRLPATFRGKRGMIQYRLKASMHRSVFSNNLYVYQEIPIRRSLVYDTIPLDLLEVIVGKDYPDKIEYIASAPSVVYREGGLVPLNLAVQLIHQSNEQQQKEKENGATLMPMTKTIKSITCALRERVTYQTTGQQSLTCQSVSQTDETFPLGWSTFYPSEDDHENYDPYKKHEYNAEFRLCPRVHPSIKTRLIKVSHTLVVNIKVTEDPLDNNNENSIHGDHQGLKCTENDQQQQESYSRTSTPLLSRSSSASSLSSIFSLGRQQASNTEEYVKDALLSFGSGGKRHSHNHSNNNNNHHSMYLCSLEVPLVVTSKQHCWEGEVPKPPEYQNTERPPTYRQSIEHLPRAPIYRFST
ncbi:hypothetical protein BDC45DRAFT_543490 [Circinella umbellata]|nr:hypothetical protein BDC45DRAFT_543490 [Circinella umbellata]